MFLGHAKYEIILKKLNLKSNQQIIMPNHRVIFNNLRVILFTFLGLGIRTIQDIVSK